MLPFCKRVPGSVRSLQFRKNSIAEVIERALYDKLWLRMLRRICTSSQGAEQGYGGGGGLPSLPLNFVAQIFLARRHSECAPFFKNPGSAPDHIDVPLQETFAQRAGTISEISHYFHLHKHDQLLCLQTRWTRQWIKHSTPQHARFSAIPSVRFDKSVKCILNWENIA